METMTIKHVWLREEIIYTPLESMLAERLLRALFGSMHSLDIRCTMHGCGEAEARIALLDEEGREIAVVDLPLGEAALPLASACREIAQAGGIDGCEPQSVSDSVRFALTAQMGQMIIDAGGECAEIVRR